jgi:endoglucanase
LEAKELLKALSEAAGVSGFEHGLEPILRRAFAPLVDEISVDVLGNFIARRRGSSEGKRPAVMLAAHMDEIGLMVTKMDERGFIKFAPVGGVDQRILPGLEVVVHGRRELPGVIGTKPPHLQEESERDKAYKLDDLFIDVGLGGAEAREVVKVGDVVTFGRRFTELGGGLCSGKGFDDRAGVVVMYECLRWLGRLRVKADVWAVATVQEEVGLKGAVVSSYGLEPDLAIAIDVGHGDSPGVPEDLTNALDKGPPLAIGPNVHPKIHQALVEAAQAAGVPVQTEVAPGSTGTDAWAIQVSRSGVPTGVVSIPLRYMHTSVETLAMGDVEKAGKLLAFFIANVDSGFVEGLTWS